VAIQPYAPRPATDALRVKHVASMGPDEVAAFERRTSRTSDRTSLGGRERLESWSSARCRWRSGSAGWNDCPIIVLLRSQPITARYLSRTVRASRAKILVDWYARRYAGRWEASSLGPNLSAKESARPYAIAAPNPAGIADTGLRKVGWSVGKTTAR